MLSNGLQLQNHKEKFIKGIQLKCKTKLVTRKRGAREAGQIKSRTNQKRDIRRTAIITDHRRHYAIRLSGLAYAIGLTEGWG